MLGAILLGPALAPGSLFNLDLILTPDIPVPPGVWGLGPELPRRVPFMVPLAWASTVISGATVGKAVMLGAVATAFVGILRLARPAPLLPRVGVAFWYAAGPFMATRLGVGHFNVFLPMAVLPWALPSLLRPHSAPRTYLWSLGLALTGFVGGVFALITVACGMVVPPRPRVARTLLLVLVAQVPWMVPGLVLSVHEGVAPADAAYFATGLDSFGDLIRVLAGHGFWQDGYQVGYGELGAVLGGAVFAGLAYHGRRELPDDWRRPATLLAGVALGIVISSSLTFTSPLYQWLANLPVGSVLREGQRCLPLFLVVAAPAAALGAGRVARQLSGSLNALVLVGPLVWSLIVLTPGLWGIDGHLRPVDLPREWVAARQMVNQDRGTVLSLPWSLYHDLAMAGGRRVVSPMPYFLGTDVLASSDSRLGEGVQETAEPREAAALALVDRLRDGEAVSDELAELGVRWVVIGHDSDWRDYTGLVGDPGLRLAVTGPTLDLYEVRDWAGEIVDEDGESVTSNPLVAPLALVDSSGRALWGHPGLPGWMRGFSPAVTTPSGLSLLPAGSGPVWYWPSLLVIAADLVTASLAIYFILRAWRYARSADGAVS